MGFQNIFLIECVNLIVYVFSIIGIKIDWLYNYNLRLDNKDWNRFKLERNKISSKKV